jgi:GNAT superfamily N-acetyltransferase
MSQEALNPDQFQMHYEAPYPGVHDWHRVEARLPEQQPGERSAGYMRWGSKTGEIRAIDVEPQYQRRGVATAMYKHAHELAATNRKIRSPRHSPDRTEAGEAWARSLGDRLPRRKPVGG